MTDARLLYRERAEQSSAQREDVAARWRRIANARLACFVLALVASLAAIDFPDTRVLFWVVAGLLLAGFVALVVLSRRLRGRLDVLTALVDVNREAVARVQRDWSALPANTPALAPPVDHPYAEDLDLFGKASLTRLLGTVRTVQGARKLGYWLGEPAPPAVIRKRHEAVGDLAPMLEFRQELEAAGLGVGDVSLAHLEGFLRWAESADPMADPEGLVKLGRVLGPAMGATALWLFALWVGGDPLGVLWILPILVNGLITGVTRKRIHASLDVVSACESAFLKYAQMIEILAAREFTGDAMREVVADLRRTGAPAPEELRRMHGLVHLGDLRRSSAAYFVFQLLALWDLHVAHGLMRWKRRSGHRARGWLDALADAEALSALAGLSHDNPRWIFPDVAQDGASVLDATALGHPMLRDDVRVVNDVQIGPPHTFLLVTGSNMSGKSTLLRAIGVNVVLAQAGGVVCASRFRMRPLRMHTSMRVRDSLEQGVSYFMAGVMRLKTIVEAARAHRPGDADFLYLLDEILQGTNTAERQVAVRSVLGELLGLETIGAVTTHDLALADTSELREASRPVHFSEVIEPNRDADAATLTFDYTLRPGIATSTNALRLLKLMGVASPPDAAPGDRG